MPRPSSPRESTGSFETPDGRILRYLLLRPSSIETDKMAPLVVFLHGSGERGDDLDLVRLHGPPKQLLDGHDLPFAVLAPQCPAGEWWSPGTLIALTEAMVADHGFDPNRLHLTGLSMGGYGTWATIAEAPRLFASAVPVCGGGDPSTANRLTHLPLWAFHGEKDKAVPVGLTRDMETALTDLANGPQRFTYYPSVGHDSWTRAYAEPELYPWMMRQTRDPAPAPPLP